MVEDVLHGWLDIGVLMDDPPHCGFPAIDVGNTWTKGDRLSSDRDFHRLGAYLVGQVTADSNQGFSSDDLTARTQMCELLPRSADLLPPHRYASDRVQDCDVWAMGPEFHHQPGIAIEQMIQRRVELV